MKHIVIGERQKAPNFSAFHWLPHGSLVSIGQHFVTTRAVHLLIRTETSLVTEADLITESDQSVWAVHSCNSWFSVTFRIISSQTSGCYIWIFLPPLSLVSDPVYTERNK